MVLPKALTGVAANIVVLAGRYFPSGSHKVGPAYTTLMEGELSGEVQPGRSTMIGPSTGNFGIGVAYVSKLKGYPAIVIMPEQMSEERYQRIRQYGGQLDLTPGSESDVILVLERTREYKRDPKNKILAQFELLPNYRFHRYVTGRSALEAARAYGNGRVAAFVSAPGSAGTIAAGDEIKARFPECMVCALEPEECSTLFNDGRGTHRIEGIGDKMVTLIHNVLTTDYIGLIHDDDCVAGLELLERRRGLLERIARHGSRDRSARWRASSGSPESATSWEPCASRATWISARKITLSPSPPTAWTAILLSWPTSKSAAARSMRRVSLAGSKRSSAAGTRAIFSTCVGLRRRIGSSLTRSRFGRTSATHGRTWRA